MLSDLPKVIHPVCGVPMVSHVVEAAHGAGLGPVIAVVPPDSDRIREALGESVQCAVQPSPRGGADAVLRARPLLPTRGTVAVLCGDAPLIRSRTLSDMVAAHLDAGAMMTLLAASVDDPSGMGRVVRGPEGGAVAVVEEEDAGDRELRIREVNAGAYVFDAAWLWDALASLPPSAAGELRLTDLVAAAAAGGGPVADVAPQSALEALGVNDRAQLARAESAMRSRIRERWMDAGVTIPDPAAVYIDAGARIGADSVILPNTHLLGSTEVGCGCVVGPNSVVTDSVISDRCRVVASFVSGSRLAEGAEVGPFSNVRDGTVMEAGARVGSFTETKQSRLGRGTRAPHLSYIGDADVGDDVNLGAGTITCNFDGERKARTTIGDGALIGSDTMLIAPVEVGAGASTGAGSVVTRDVAPGDLVVGVPARRAKRGRDDGGR